MADAAIRPAIEAWAQQHRLHEQASLKGIGLRECKALHGFLELGGFEVAAILAQQTINEGLEHEAHLPLVSRSVSIEKGQIIVKMLIFVYEVDALSQVNIEKRENAWKESHWASVGFIDCLLQICIFELGVTLSLCDRVTSWEVDSEHFE